MTENLLRFETSPYLLQHKDNPVHWYPWGDQAFAAARSANKPILLSIGYAACHWCHVMAHESFEDQQTADVMNELFINVKIDREEYPDVDKLYMASVQAFGEQGGWPLTVFLEPDGTPFWGGTYFPKYPRYGRPGFTQILNALSQTWTNEREKITTNKAAILQALNNTHNPSESKNHIDQNVLTKTADHIVSITDAIYGGLSGAPKFPQTTIYTFLWRMFLKTGNNDYRQAVLTTLTHLCQGGIYDHLAGGFARYSTDERWLAPHFEKMLYDNALILELLILVNHTENNKLFRQRIKETVLWLVSDMKTSKGAFAASYDADSEGEEGTHYVWSYHEINRVIPEANRNLFCQIYNITLNGNWEGKNIPNRLDHPDLLSPQEEQTLQETRKLLLDVRNRRPKPGWDDKTLTDWNGLAISMLCDAGFALSQYDLIDQAINAFAAIKQTLWKDNELFHSYRDGKTTNYATADDFANLIKAALSLYQATQSSSYLKDAENLVSQMNDYHWNDKDGGYHFASSKTSHLLVRSIDAHDDATPNANGTMLTNLAKLYYLTGHTRYDNLANKILGRFSQAVLSSPLAHTGMLSGFLDLDENIQAVIVTTNMDKSVKSFIQVLQTSAHPVTISVINENDSLPDDHPANGKTCISEKTTVYICKNQTCSNPVTELDSIKNTLDNISDIH